MSDETEDIIDEFYLSFRWPCCRSCDGWRCDMVDIRERINVTVQIVREHTGSIALRVSGEDSVEFKTVLGLNTWLD